MTFVGKGGVAVVALLFGWIVGASASANERSYAWPEMQEYKFHHSSARVTVSRDNHGVGQITLDCGADDHVSIGYSAGEGWAIRGVVLATEPGIMCKDSSEIVLYIANMVPIDESHQLFPFVIDWNDGKIKAFRFGFPAVINLPDVDIHP